MASRTAEYYRKNPAARRRRLKQQDAYQNTEKGDRIKKRANKLRRELKIRKGDPRDAAHYKGSTSTGRPQLRSKNRASRTK